MSTALALVKSDLGQDAVILHTRTYRKRVFFGLGGHQVVEITASDGAEINRRRDKAKRKVNAIASGPPSDVATRYDARGEVGGIGTDRKEASSRTGDTAGLSTQDLIRRTYSAARASMGDAEVGEATTHDVATEAVSQAAMPVAEHVAGPMVSPPIASIALPVPVGGTDSQLAEELRAVKRMVSRMAQKQDSRFRGAREGDGAAGEKAAGEKGGVERSAGERGGGVSDELFDQYLALLEQEVTEELAREVIEQVEEVLDEESMQDSEKVKEATRVALAALIPIDPDAGKLPEQRPGRPAGPCKIALIGPTGVGKTTTIAKLAADLKLKQGKKVGMITLDTYRIAAVDQLQTYANIIGVPLFVASNESELSDVVSRCGGLDVVLIDTAGRSQRDDPRLEQLQKFVEIADPDQVHLVLSSTCSQKVLLETAERFSKTRIDRIIFTKLDEAVSFGVLLNVARKVNKNLSYLTTGQEVPHQIEPGGSDRLAALVMGEAV